ncbi:PGF-CTERM sorting domain-containing protein [Halobaculum sp. MBLA0147]|uniref:DUF7490 domain-containing protein n=1 Tax=Halobaculum sp. MBLA0147 TaxID=3079934 RepID=UPI003524B166
MTRERTLIVAALVILLSATAAAVAVPGVLAERREPERPGYVDIAEVPVTPGEVSGETAELRLLARLDHEGGPAENVSVRFRAYDAASGLLQTERTVAVGTLDDDRSVQVNGSLRVEREGGYVLETTVFRDGEVVDEQRRTVSGVEALVPPYARSAVRFTDREALPAVAVAVADAGGNRTTLELAASLTNGGDAPSGDLRVEFVLRQADSNVRAARASEAVGSIRPGRTAETTTRLAVPTGYNYFVDVVLYRDDVVIDTARSVANLAPEERLSADETVREVKFDVGDFDPEAGPDGEDRRPDATVTEQSSGGAAPGFGPAVAVVALAAVALLARRVDR